MIRRPPRSTLFPYNDALPIYPFHLLGQFIERGLPVLGKELLRELLEDHGARSEEHTSELQSQSNLVCRLLLEKKKIRPLRWGTGRWTRICTSAALKVTPPGHP